MITVFWLITWLIPLSVNHLLWHACSMPSNQICFCHYLIVFWFSLSFTLFWHIYHLHKPHSHLWLVITTTLGKYLGFIYGCIFLKLCFTFRVKQMRSDIWIAVTIIDISTPQKMEEVFAWSYREHLWNNYLKPNPPLGKAFSKMFCISCSRFEKLMQDIMGSLIPFFSDIFSRNRKSAASLKVRPLMPIKFLNSLQMSEEFGRRACKELDATIKQCYSDEFLCLPTVIDNCFVA